MKAWYVAVAAVIAALHVVQPAAARDNLLIVGTSTSVPFARAVAERVAQAAGAPAPVVERTSPALAFGFVCGGTGADYPDAVSVPRRMKRAELDVCRKNGVTEIAEIPVGLDVLTVAQSNAGPALRLTSGQMLLALAKLLPDEAGELNANPHQRWSDIDSALPGSPIDLHVLPRYSGPREALQELFLQKGVQSLDRIAKHWTRDGAIANEMRAIREDRPFVVTHESEEAIVRHLSAHPDALGILAYSSLQASRASLRGIAIDGAEPTPEQIYAGRYPGTRKAYLYVNKARIDAVPGLGRLGAEYVSSAALGPGGYLLAMGFLPLPVDDLFNTMALVDALPPLSDAALPD